MCMLSLNQCRMLQVSQRYVKCVHSSRYGVALTWVKLQVAGGAQLLVSTRLQGQAAPPFLGWAMTVLHSSQSQKHELCCMELKCMASSAEVVATRS
jgi:hypothetical protein